MTGGRVFSFIGQSSLARLAGERIIWLGPGRADTERKAMRIQCLGTLLLLGVATTTVAQPITLAQLRTQLQSMEASAPLSAEISLSDSTTSGDKDKPKMVQGRIALHIDDGADGFGIRLPADVLAHASKESEASALDADVPTPTSNALGTLGPVMLNGIADFAPVLLCKLEGAKLTGQQDAVRAGERVHVMTFDIPSQIGKAMKSSVNEYKGQLTVWLDGNGVPVAAHESRHYKGSKFFISFAFFGNKDYDLQRVGQRLVVQHYHSVQGSTGMGSTTRRTLDIELTPTATAPVRTHGG